MVSEVSHGLDRLSLEQRHRDATERLETDRVERITSEIRRRARDLPTGGKLVVAIRS